jgi:hypothetical protein
LTSLLVDYTIFVFLRFSLVYLIHPVCRCAQHFPVLWDERVLLQHVCSYRNHKFSY